MITDSQTDDFFYTDNIRNGEKYFDPEKQMWKDGFVARISSGYGSKLDGDIYFIGICDNCANINTKNGRLRYVGDYMNMESKYSIEELNDFDKKRLRENNLDELI